MFTKRETFRLRRGKNWLAVAGIVIARCSRNATVVHQGLDGTSSQRATAPETNAAKSPALRSMKVSRGLFPECTKVTILQS